MYGNRGQHAENKQTAASGRDKDRRARITAPPRNQSGGTLLLLWSDHRITTIMILACAGFMMCNMRSQICPCKSTVEHTRNPIFCVVLVPACINAPNGAQTCVAAPCSCGMGEVDMPHNETYSVWGLTTLTRTFWRIFGCSAETSFRVGRLKFSSWRLHNPGLSRKTML